MKIKGKTALVTGASRGIGKAIALELARQGIQHLLLVARDRQRLSEVATEITTMGVKVTTLSVDLKQSSAINIAIAQAWRTHRPIHLLVNCAGVAHQAPFLETQLPKVEEEISINLLGMMTITRLLAKRMANQQEGTIVNVSSLMGKVAAPTMSTYSATKFAIIGFTQALRSELASHNIKVAQAMVAGLDKDQNSGEILVGWQSYLAVWCQRIFPQLLQKILVLTAPTF
jgi:3-oxoacyl-[acyl-carrier protein] reductase